MFPTSFAQQRMWFLDQLEPGKAVYNVTEAIRLTGLLNVETLERSINEIIKRHESLRTTFSLIDERPVQIVAPTLHVRLLVHDFLDLSESQREQQVALSASEEAGRPFDLQCGPLLRATLFQSGKEEHVLLLVMHHIISEGGWSMSIFLREMGILYNAYSSGQTPFLPELEVQYGDYSVWQRESLQGDVLDQQLTYWKAQLKDAPTIFDWSINRQRPAVQTHQGARKTLLLPKHLMRGLNALARAERSTLFTTLLAAFQTLLYRYTGQDDFVVGAPVAGRTPQTQNLIGLFINTVPLRSRVSSGVSFRELMKWVRQVVFDSLAHQDAPFEALVDALNPARSLASTPVFQVMFAFQNAPLQDLELNGLDVKPYDVEIRSSMLDLTLFAWEKRDGLRIVFEYSTDLFEEGTIRRMLSHFEVLLEGIVSNPDEQLSRLPLLTESEREQILYEWNDTAVEFTEGKPGMCVQELFEVEAERRPEAVAVEFEGQRLSYGELDARANQLASYLREKGVGPDRLVGILMERSLEMVVALYGVLKAGGAYVPLDPSFPRERLDYMVKDSGMAVLITHGQLGQQVQSWPGTMVRVDAEREEIAQQDRGWKSAPGDLGQLAYVLYTSGSTGQPKGVEIPHSAVVNFLLSMQREPGFGTSDIMLAVTTLCFDIAGLELHLPLISGGKVVIASYEDTRDPMRLLECMRGSQCTVMQATPATWRALIDGGWSGSPGLKVLCGGESLPQDLRGKLLRRCKELWNMYGPTETTIWSTLEPVKSAEGPVLIGRPIANTQTWVLDANRNLVPEGVVGELYIGGAGVARGYLGRGELTEERFIASPFAKDGRLYRTGDLARWKAGGRLECLGRVDRQVKVRGYRIELEEIEAVLGQHEGVGQCVVVAREQAGGDQRLVAYFERRTATTPSVGDLRGYLGQRLPEYMIPSAFVAMDKLPMTPNRKIDRKALPAGEIEGVSEGGYVAPRNQREEQLAQLWAQVLKLERVGIHDNFFHLGGHSLTATQLISRIRAVMGVKVPLRSVFEAPTVAAFSEYVESVRQYIDVAREETESDKRLTAYFEPDTETVRHGQIDGKALPIPVYDRIEPADNFVPPQTEVEKVLARIWTELLEVDKIGINDDFFNLGGHSFLAIRAASRIREVFGVDIPVQTLFENSTIADLENVLVSGKGWDTKTDQHQLLVRIRSGSSDRPPFFCVHGTGGNVLNMRALAMALRPDLPIYCFQDKGLDGSEPFDNVEEAGRCYVDEIRRVQPHGPYYLAGTCYGGLLAFETARRLEASGEPVASLVLIDTFNPTFVSSLSQQERFFGYVRFCIRRVVWHTRKLSQGPGERLAYISQLRKALLKRMRELAEEKQANLEARMIEAVPHTSLGDSLSRVIHANFVAQSKFVPKPYGGDALIFRASARNLDPYDDYYLGWKSVVRGAIECFEIEGDHMSILEHPAVELIAEKLNTQLVRSSIGIAEASAIRV
jgi:amino acid adenylation domain-containing protein